MASPETKKSIIFVCQRVPYPPDRGDRITTWNFIKHLSKNFTIHLFCLCSSRDELKKQTVLQDYCKTVTIAHKPAWRSCLDVFFAIFSGKPLSVAYFFSEEIKARVKNLTARERISFAYAYSSHVFYHIYGLDVKKVFHLADIDSEKWKKLKENGPFLMKGVYSMEFSRLRKWELMCDKAAACSVVCTDAEKMLYQSAGAKSNIVVINNGVDFEYFKNSQRERKENAVIFTGVMDYYPNVDAVVNFFNRVLPLLKKDNPEIKFYIVGSNPTKKVKDLGRKDANCIVTGYVNDVRPFMERAKVYVAPIRIAQGIQNKILEALAMSLPVITSLQISGMLGLTESQGVIPARDSEEMSRKILGLLNKPEVCNKLGAEGRAAVIKRYSWAGQFVSLDKMINSIT